MAFMVCDFRAVCKNMTGLTQQEMATTLGCSRTKVQRVERGDAYYSPAELVSLAQSIGSSVDALLGLEQRSPEWLARYRGLQQDQQQLIDEVVASLLAYIDRGM